MDWMEPGVWVDKGVNVKWAKLDARRIKTVWFDPTDSGVAGPIAEAHERGMQVGLDIDPHRYGNPGPVEFARIVSAAIARLIPGRGNPVMVDLEGLSKRWVAAFTVAYRLLRPQRDTAYTNAPWQDGTVVPTLALRLARFHWFVQLYMGAEMVPVDAAAALLQVTRIYPSRLVHPFYDGARLPTDARDGCVFTMERLP